MQERWEKIILDQKDSMCQDLESQKARFMAETSNQYVGNRVVRDEGTKGNQKGVKLTSIGYNKNKVRQK